MSDELENVSRGMPERPRRGPRPFGPGDVARTRTGAFASFKGEVEGTNQAKRLPRVRVEVFGRERPLKLGYAEVETVSFP